MPRHTAATDAAINGLVGLVLLSIGSIVASALGTIFDPVIAAIPALIVWIVCAFYGLKQFAYGLYTLIEDATS
jgi:hypothetical protein